MYSISVVALSLALNSGSWPGVSDMTGRLAVTNAATLEGAVAPGSLAILTGANMAASEAEGGYADPPRQLGGTSVEIDGRTAGLLYVSAERIVLRVPVGVLPGRATVVVNSVGRSKLMGVAEVHPVAPGIFLAGEGTAVVENENGSMNSATTPAGAGSSAIVQLTGCDLAKSGKESFAVRIGAAGAEVTSVGPALGMPGVTLLRAVLPKSASGAQTLQVFVDGVASNKAVIWIR